MTLLKRREAVRMAAALRRIVSPSRAAKANKGTEDLASVPYNFQKYRCYKEFHLAMLSNPIL